MSGSAFVRRFLGAFRRKAPPPAFHADAAADPLRAETIAAQQDVPLHPLATAGAAGGSEPIVVGPPELLESFAPESPDDELPPPTPAVVEFVNGVRQLPLFSTTAMQLMRTFDDDDVAPEQIARMVSADAGLVAQLLRIVNSPYYGLPKRCSTIATAIVVLGLDRLRRTVLAAVTHRPLMAYLHDTQVVQTFWRHQLLCAALARHIAGRDGLDGEMAYMAGLMHEVGRLAILMRHPELIDVLLKVEDEDAGEEDGRGTGSRAALRYERRHLGFDHAEIGGALLDRWGLPPAIVRATREHERVSQPADRFSAAVWRANRIAHILAEEIDVADGAGDGDGEASPWMQTIGLSVTEHRRILDEIAALEVGP